jgi:hypothetical protein
MTLTTASKTTSTICDELDRFEGINAAEWDEVPKSQKSAEQQEITPMIRLENEKVRLSSYLRDQIHFIIIS